MTKTAACSFCRGHGVLPNMSLADGWVQLSGTIKCPVCEGRRRVAAIEPPRWPADDPIWTEPKRPLKQSAHEYRRKNNVRPKPKPLPLPTAPPTKAKPPAQPASVVLPRDDHVPPEQPDNRNLTGYLMGDPQPERSALAAKIVESLL